MRYAVIGVGGYIAIRHLEAIKKNGDDVVLAYDINDSVGVLDSVFPDCIFVKTFELYDYYLDFLNIDRVSICSPNYLHFYHAVHALKKNKTVVCEKPLVLSLEHLNQLEEIEQSSEGQLYCVLQLRFHEAVLKLKQQVESSGEYFEVDLTYITSRGPWYKESWKGDISKSGGILFNIGIHFFDMLLFVFGPVAQSSEERLEAERASGVIEFSRAKVRWFLSIDSSDLPSSTLRTYRSITYNGTELEFSGGFTDLHNFIYQEIDCGRGVSLSEAKKSLILLNQIVEKNA